MGHLLDILDSDLNPETGTALLFGYLVTAPNHRCVLPSNLQHVRSLVGSYLSAVGQGRGVFPGGFEAASGTAVFTLFSRHLRSETPSRLCTWSLLRTLALIASDFQLCGHRFATSSLLRVRTHRPNNAIAPPPPTALQSHLRRLLVWRLKACHRPCGRRLCRSAVPARAR
jgi:hypothetical protein